MSQVFVYGSLKKGFHNHRYYLEHAKFLGNATTEPIFTMLHLGGFPGIVRGGETTIHGELYEVNAETLQRLDRLEGHPTFYERQPLVVTLEDSLPLAVEGYVLQSKDWHSRWPAIESGVWS